MAVVKTAISLPEDVFYEADRIAKAMRISRSELYVTALKRFMEDMRADDVTERLNRVYENDPQTPDPFLHELTLRTFLRNEW